MDVHGNGGFACFHAGVQIHQARDRADFFRHLGGQPLQLLQVGALQRKLDLFTATHRVQQAHMGHRDAGHLLQALAQHTRHLVHTALAVAPVHQPHIDVGVVLSGGVAGVDGGECVAHLGQLAQDGVHLAGLGFGQLQRRTHGCVEVDAGF